MDTPQTTQSDTPTPTTESLPTQQSSVRQPTVEQQKQPIPDESVQHVVAQGAPPKSPTKKIIAIVIILILITGGGALGFVLLNKKKLSQPSTDQKLKPTSTLDTAANVTDSFNDTSLNLQNWLTWSTTGLGRIEQRDGGLEIEIPAGMTEYTSAGVDSVAVLKGDFEATVDLEITQGGEGSTSNTGFIFHEDTEDWLNQLSIFLRKEPDGTYSLRAVSVRDESSELGSKSFTHPGPFTVRIERSGSMATFSVKEEGAFASLGLAVVYQGSGRISLHVNSREPDYPSVVSTFDNLTFLQK